MREGTVEPLDVGDPAQVGHFRLVARLGVGGMGCVYLGTSPGGRRVAVKVIRDTLAGSADFRNRFRREIASARSVSGLYTAPVVDADLDARLPWLATAYVPGPSLADAVARHGPLPLGSVLALMAGLAEGLAAIHAAGLVHRDLKPANVLLADDGPRVIDFGISRAMEATTLTQTGLVMGSAGFMSPEQAEGVAVGPASDVFSLGSVLAYAATGEGPFGLGSAAALVYRVVNAQPDLARVPAEIRPLLARCLDKDPAARPTPAALLAELTQRGGAQVLEGWLPAEIMADYRAGVAAVIRSSPTGAGAPSVTVPGAAQPAETAFPWFSPPGTGLDPVIAMTPGPPPATGDVPPPLPGQRPASPGRRRRRVLFALAASAAVLSVTAGAVAMANPMGNGHRLTGKGNAGAPARETSSRLGSLDAGTAAPAANKTNPPMEAHAVPAIPVGVRAVPKGRYDIDVSWAGSMTDVTGYHISTSCPPSGCGGGARVKTTGNVAAASFAVTPGAHECFRVQAFNLGGTSGWSRPSCASTPGLVVPGTRKWTNTGVEVRPGERLGLTASGIVRTGGEYPAFNAGPGGEKLCLPDRDYPTDVFPIPSAPCWSLIARIGNGQPFYVGTSDLVMTGPGELYLGVNGDDMGGNSGAWTVNIKIGALPPSP
jgi:hypothetical protein